MQLTVSNDTACRRAYVTAQGAEDDIWQILLGGCACTPQLFLTIKALERS